MGDCSGGDEGGVLESREAGLEELTLAFDRGAIMI